MRILAMSAAVVLLAGCVFFQPIHRLEAVSARPEGPSRVLAYRIVHDAPDHLALKIQYFYDGVRGENVFIGAITKFQGQSTGFWAYRPDSLLPGRHWAKVVINLSDEAPATHATDEVLMEMYAPGGAPFVSQAVPYRKMWQRVKPAA